MDNGHEIEVVMEVGDTLLTVLITGDAWPLVCADEVVKERCCRANEATCLCRAVARSVRAGPEVAALVIVGQPGSAAIDCIGA